MLIIRRPSADGGRVSIGVWSFHFCGHRYYLSDSGGVVYATAFFITSTALGSILLMNISSAVIANAYVREVSIQEQLATRAGSETTTGTRPRRVSLRYVLTAPKQPQPTSAAHLFHSHRRTSVLLGRPVLDEPSSSQAVLVQQRWDLSSKVAVVARRMSESRRHVLQLLAIDPAAGEGMSRRVRQVFTSIFQHRWHHLVIDLAILANAAVLGLNHYDAVR